MLSPAKRVVTPRQGPGQPVAPPMMTSVKDLFEIP